ncbi:hypothetical protein D0T84_18515 [Dysgonomonas sp. 521]|uniref:hypothetical protein n=1 Tax=Dysgonomonas sp. 521 TaxID=2302932 RepID=UPI0013D8B05A|nr:hypothetical protein [Dysgonomonas sp. 521]NDV96884.1 hypothetical protein [Dysgonomonas sp. 521]
MTNVYSADDVWNKIRETSYSYSGSKLKEGLTLQWKTGIFSASSEITEPYSRRIVYNEYFDFRKGAWINDTKRFYTFSPTGKSSSNTVYFALHPVSTDKKQAAKIKPCCL